MPCPQQVPLAVLRGLATGHFPVVMQEGTPLCYKWSQHMHAVVAYRFGSALPHVQVPSQKTWPPFALYIQLTSPMSPIPFLTKEDHLRLTHLYLFHVL